MNEYLQYVLNDPSLTESQRNKLKNVNFIKSDSSYVNGNNIYIQGNPEDYIHEIWHYVGNDKQQQNFYKDYYDNLDDNKIQELGGDLDFVKRTGDPSDFYNPSEIFSRVQAAKYMLNKSGISKYDSNLFKNIRKNENMYGYNLRDLLHMYNDNNLEKIFNILYYKSGGKSKMKIEIGDKEYNVTCARTEEERIKGLQGVTELKENEGMLFFFEEPQTVDFWMKDTKIPLDIIFIDEDMEVISIYKGKPESTTMAEEDNVKFVLEVNQGSGIKEGDELDIEEDEALPTMKVIAPDGSTQMELEGGERIFSRKNTRTLIRMAKKAKSTKSESDYKRLGKKMFSYIKQQDEREPEYVKKKE